MKLISVVIPTLNEEHYLEKTLKSIIRQTIPRDYYEIIISDGKSKDNTLKIAKKYADKIISKKNKSIGEARNIGAKEAKGKYIVFLDADTTIPKNLFKRILDVFENDKKIAGAFVIYKYTSESLLIRMLNSIFNLLEIITNIFVPELLVVSGACIIVRATKFRKIGGFKESLKTSEDNDLIMRLRKVGKIVVIKEKVHTSDRRLRKMGLIGLLKYYAKDAIEHRINKRYKGNYLHIEKV